MIERTNQIKFTFQIQIVPNDRTMLQKNTTPFQSLQRVLDEKVVRTKMREKEYQTTAAFGGNGKSKGSQAEKNS